MVTVAQVKNYLRIPYNDDDTMLSGAITSGYDYLKSAVDNYDDLYDGNEEFQRKADYWVLTQWMPSAYDQREGLGVDMPTLSFVARSLLIQLQTFVFEGV